jgi:SPP1 gp7 family putative phage head morphogenesis protein
MRLPQKKVVKQVGFDITNPAVIEWIREHVAGLVALITEQTRNAIKEVIEYHYVKGYHVRTTAKQIKNLVGLTRGQAKAVATYESELLGRGLTRDVIDKRLERYGKSLLKRRAEMIARTETSEAVNYGRKKAWDDAVEDGIIDDRTVYREWVTGADERVCPICGPMHGQTRALDEPFDTPDGEVDNPPAHPNCRCTMIMRQGDTGKLPPRARPEKQKNRFGGPIGKPRKLKR